MLKSRKIRPDSLSLNMAYDIDNDKFLNIGFTTDDIGFYINQRNEVEELLFSNEFKDYGGLNDYNYFDDFYGDKL